MTTPPPIHIGIDDTDTLDTRGTNQLARSLARCVSAQFTCQRITRHQLLNDPRIPYTSKNGSASLVLQAAFHADLARLATMLSHAMRDDYVPGSDPGLCVALGPSESVQRFGRRCQREIVTQQEARQLAASEGILLLGLGGTEDGVIGALAAVGLAAQGNDGRVVHACNWREDLAGRQSVDTLREFGVRVRDWESNQEIETGIVDVGKKLRPNWREHGCVLYVRRGPDLADGSPLFQALKIP
jgi:hypothetical protein